MILALALDYTVGTEDLLAWFFGFVIATPAPLVLLAVVVARARQGTRWRVFQKARLPGILGPPVILFLGGYLATELVEWLEEHNIVRPGNYYWLTWYVVLGSFAAFFSVWVLLAARSVRKQHRTARENRAR